ncbi:MAG: cell division protein SepF [Clostridia bacterium]|jgi:cell division inhibitor SepF|nr:cell division protein SepF [Clostridia bacterium]
MANAIRKFWNSLMEVEEDWESELDYPEEQRESYSYEYEEPEQERRQSTRRSNQANVTAFPGAYSGKLIVYRPVSYEDTQNIIDNLKAQKAVIVNMEQIDVEVAQRILDFMSGASYAVNGRVYKVSSRIFIVAPANINIVGSSDGSGE